MCCVPNCSYSFMPIPLNLYRCLAHGLKMCILFAYLSLVCATPRTSCMQAFRFMVGPGHCPIISKYDPSLSKAVGPVDPSFLVVKKSHFNKKYSSYSESTNFTKQRVHVGCQYSETCLKQPLKKDKTKILIQMVV